MIPRKSSGALEWNECRRLVSRLGANLDVVVRSDPEVCGLSGDDFRLSLHHSGHGDCTVGSMSLVDCPNSLVVEEFLRWMQQAGRLQDEAGRLRGLRFERLKKLRSCRARTAAASQFASHTRLHFMLSLMFVVSLRDVISEPTA